MKSPPKMKKRFLKSKEARLLEREVNNRFGVEMDSARFEEWTLEEEVKLLLSEGKPLLLQIRERLLPTLVYHEALEHLPKVVVDMGAVPHICGGADIMAPGITRVQGEFEREEVVVIRDERYGKALALGLSLFSSGDMRERERGKVVKNLHYVGDKIWDVYK